MSRERPKRGVLPPAQEKPACYRFMYVSLMKNACFIANMSLLRGIWKLWIYFIQVPAFNWNMGRSFGGSCFNCGRSGHRASECPDKIAYLRLFDRHIYVYSQHIYVSSSFLYSREMKKKKRMWLKFEHGLGSST
ncbi:hypothetical protein L484_026255 [Morus notabilis]|uniref:CCHC-type domain-containing protein n=1 Tax=Morus notabilis TaxID=981085 RepID=W9RUZ8_9ROSA|nr:hypothetical protein L484_026255 [Morus notabilis]